MCTWSLKIDPSACAPRVLAGGSKKCRCWVPACVIYCPCIVSANKLCSVRQELGVACAPGYAGRIRIRPRWSPCRFDEEDFSRYQSTSGLLRYRGALETAGVRLVDEYVPAENKYVDARNDSVLGESSGAR